jgi:hypothetical protein
MEPGGIKRGELVFVADFSFFPKTSSRNGLLPLRAERTLAAARRSGAGHGLKPPEAAGLNKN